MRILYIVMVAWLSVLSYDLKACINLTTELDAQLAEQQGDYRRSYQLYLDLSQCQPSRGDLRIELYRLALLSHDFTAAQYHRDWLAKQPVPENLTSLLNLWHVNAQDTAMNTSSAEHLLSLELSVGYRSNANDMSDSRFVPVNFQGIPLLLELNQRKTPSPINQLGLEYRYNSDSQLAYISQQSTEYKRLKEVEHRINTGLLHSLSCGQYRCELNAHLGYQQRGKSHQHQLQLGNNIHWKHTQMGIYYRHIYPSQEPQADILGLEWRGRWKTIQLHAGIEQENPRTPRAGEERFRMFGSLSYQPINTLRMMASYINERDKQAYAPIFWGERHRDRQLYRLQSEYILPINKQLDLKAELHWQESSSEIPLFQFKGWGALVTLNWKL